jgi:hypothetical protein
VLVGIHQDTACAACLSAPGSPSSYPTPRPHPLALLLASPKRPREACRELGGVLLLHNGACTAAVISCASKQIAATRHALFSPLLCLALNQSAA